MYICTEENNVAGKFIILYWYIYGILACTKQAVIGSNDVNLIINFHAI